MEIDAQTLKESYLGRVVLFYTKAPKVQGPIKRQADNLVQAWSRPILGRSSDMRNRKVLNIKDLDLTAAAEDLDAQGGDESTQGQSQSQSQSQARSQGQKIRKKRVDWNERAEINTTAKGARLEKASVSNTPLPHFHEETLMSRTSNTRSHLNRCIKEMIERGMNICEGSRWIILGLTSLQGK
jgi:hypothetical protein